MARKQQKIKTISQAPYSVPRGDYMDEVKITFRTATGAVLHSMEELEEYVRDLELPDFIQRQVDRICAGGGSGRTQGSAPDGATVQRRHYEQKQSHAPQVDGADG